MFASFFGSLQLLFGLLILAGGAFNAYVAGTDLWSDVTRRDATYEPASQVRLDHRRCYLFISCDVRLDGGQSAMGRDAIRYAAVWRPSPTELKPVRAKADGSISLEPLRSMLGQRIMVLLVLTGLMLAAGLLFTRKGYARLRARK